MNTTNTQHDNATLQAAIDEAFQIPELNEAGALCTYQGCSSQVWSKESKHRLALARALLARLPSQAPAVEAEPATFEAHGRIWTKHNKGDPMPCDGSRKVCIYRNETESLDNVASLGDNWIWQDETIIGWRYADEPKAEPALAPPPQPWQPAVGDVVRLKSGGPEMTIRSIHGDLYCNYFDGESLQSPCFPAACLQPAKEEQS